MPEVCSPDHSWIIRNCSKKLPGVSFLVEVVQGEHEPGEDEEQVDAAVALGDQRLGQPEQLRVVPLENLQVVPGGVRVEW